MACFDTKATARLVVKLAVQTDGQSQIHIIIVLIFDHSLLSFVYFFWSGGTQVLLACPHVTSFWPSNPPP